MRVMGFEGVCVMLRELHEGGDGGNAGNVGVWGVTKEECGMLG